MSDDIELSYLAGFFDGEGCVSIYHSKKLWGAEVRPRHHIRAFVVNTDRQVPDRFRELFGGSLYIDLRKNPKHKVAYRWNVNGGNAAKFLYVIQPYLRIKYDLAELALEFQRCLHNGNGKGASWAYTQEEQDYLSFLTDEIHRLNRKGNDYTDD